ncbi:MAG: CvpA family protein [Candidatus Omnitrophica bacterium]|nr:CvpA family protein [Candidatus Omnitrophota bacterium]
MINAITQFNFLDVIIVIISLRICYVAFQMGLAVEFFKLSGVILATYLSLHYYTGLSDIIQRRFIPKGMPLEFMDLLVFIILAAGGYLLFVVLRNSFYRFMKLEASPKISQFGGLTLGLARLFFTVGLLIYILMISGIKYLNDSVKYSYLGSRSTLISSNTYGWLWGSIISKFSPNEKFNPTVTELLERFNRK